MFLDKYRIYLGKGQDINHLSAGLQPKVVFSSENSEDDDFSNIDLITTSKHDYCFGGSILWKQKGSFAHPITGSPLPVYKKESFINLNNGIPFPVQNHANINGLITQGGITFLQRKENNIFEINEEWEELIGGGAFQHNIFGFKFAKVELRDLTNNGKLDLIFGTNDNSQYFPSIEKDGKTIITRWGDKEYIPFDSEGKWRGGPWIGEVYYLENLGPNPEFPEETQFRKLIKCKNVNQYGYCTPAIGDFTNTGLEDMICGDFLHSLTFFKRIDPPKCPSDDPIQFEEGVPLLNQEENPINLIGVINYVESFDITNNGLLDLIVGSESGYISVLENLGITKKGVPLFQDQLYLLQHEAPLKADILCVPAVAELRKDSNKLDMVLGTGAGFFDFYADIQSEHPLMMWHVPDIERIRPNDLEAGSIQGPSEIGWGYVCPTLFDWNGNGKYDLIFSGINGEHSISFNIGTIFNPQFSKPQKLIDIETGQPLLTVWRVKPTLLQNSQGKIHYYCLDEEGKFASYEKLGKGNDLQVRKIGRVLSTERKEFTFTKKFGGSRGRIKFQFFDWTQNGIPDLLIGTPKNHNFEQIFTNPYEYKRHQMATVACSINEGTFDNPRLRPPQYLTLKYTGKPIDFGHHSCAPEAYSYNGMTYLLVGAEDGQLYRIKKDEFN